MLQLYRESNLLPDVLRQKNSAHCNPLRSAIVNDQFKNTVLLFKECLAVAEDAITAHDPKSIEMQLSLYLYIHIYICMYSYSHVAWLPCIPAFS